MDVNTLVASSGISIGFYGLYKGAIRLYQHYYLSSECHARSLTISIEEIPSKVIEMEKPTEKESLPPT